MDMYVPAETGTHVAAKRPRVDYNMQPSALLQLTVPNPRQSNGGVLSQQYIEQQLNKKCSGPEKANHILLFTILNPSYPITCNILRTICAPMGNVERVVIFKKNGVQAMVEFSSVEMAQEAKEGLHGCDIYSGCCTLKIEFAKPAKLNVYKNDPDNSWDYSNPNLNVTQVEPIPFVPSNSTNLRPVLLMEPSAADMGASSPQTGHGGKKDATMIINDVNCDLDPFHNAHDAGGHRASQRRTVCMVYGLNLDHMNTARLFNLFCLYGNVVRIKFLKTKEGCAMVQMGDALAVERLISNLNNTNIFGSKMQISFSKQAFLADVQIPYHLLDGTSSFQDFVSSKHNRFLNREMASKNRIQCPSRILHFFNTPPGLKEIDIQNIFESNGSPKPTCVTLFAAKTDRSSSGLVEFENLEEALESLVLCNHQPISTPNGKFPYIMKLCFSSSRNLPPTLTR